MNVIKKDGKQVAYDLSKIKRAVGRANKDTQELTEADVLDVVNVIHSKLLKITREISSKEIQKLVEDTLMRKKFYETARSYIEYRYQKELDKKQNTTDSQILNTVNLENEEVKQENSNKNPTLIPTQRDYVAGLVSKDLTNRYLLPKDIQDAHNAGIIHFHDADYFIQKCHNCTDGDAWIKIKDVDDNVRNIKIKDFSSELGLNNNETRDLKYSNYQILSRNGWTKFKALTKRDLRKDEDLYVLKPKSGLNLKLTGEHRLPVIRDGKETLLEVKDIKVGDSLLSIDKCEFSIEEINNNFLNLSKIDSDLDIRIVNIVKLKQYLRYKYDIVFNDYINSLGVNENRAVNDNITKEEFNLILKDFEIPFDVLTSLRIKNKGSKHTYPLLIPYTEDLAKIYGYIYADGSVYVNEKESLYQLGFFNTNEDIMDDFLDSYENVFGYRMNKSYPNEKSTSPCIRVTDGSKIITSMFYNFAGAHKFCVNNISIPDFILNGTDSIKHAFLSACIDTDGCLGEKAITYTTCSDNYADQFVYLLTSLGYHPHKRLQYEAGSTYKVWNKVGTRNYNCYNIVISNNSDIKKLNEKLATVKYQESYAYLGTSANLNYNQIISIKKIDSNEPVYDISTGDHWFILNNFVSHNCDLWNLDDMLQNGTVINGVKIDKPHSFLTACTIATQIMAIVASCQFGGQTITLSHLAPFVNVSRQRIIKEIEEENRESHIKMTKVKVAKIAEKRLRKEIKDGVQTIQYQILTLNSTNGQTPFVSLAMYLGEVEDTATKDDLAMIIEEVLTQRIRGIKNKKGIWVTPAFPKLLYVLEEDNIHKDSKYFYLTELAARCTAKRMVPDYISEKVMKETKINENGDGDCYPCIN